MDNYGFIITRHVNSEITNHYWNRCIKCINHFYSNKKIIIIDDNSNPEFVKPFQQYNNIQIIESEYPGRGELLPYYYFHKFHFFENAFIMHDSVFIHKRLAIEKLIGVKVLPLWHFDKIHYHESSILANNLKNNNEIITKLEKQYIQEVSFISKVSPSNNEWYGCFGVMSFINYGFLNDIQNKYDVFKLLEFVTCRSHRCSLERIFGAIFCTENKALLKNSSIFGDIMLYQKFGNYTYDIYMEHLNQKRIVRNIVKVWTGR